ncbi:reverse transcriptase domain-containing protein [Klebsiella pneumoniae]
MRSLIDPHFPEFVYRLLKALYGLKQAPRAWYDTLSQFLIDNQFTRGTIDKTLFFKLHGNDIILVQIYVDDIIFGSTNEKLCQRFSKLMQSKYEMSMMGELTFFLGLQVSQRKDGIFISQAKYVKDLLKKFDLEDFSPTKTSMPTATKLDEDKK